MSTLRDVLYDQESGNTQWNTTTPTLEWTAHQNDDEEVFLPYLSDVILHVSGMMYYCHITKLASGPRGSVFLGNVIAMNREKNVQGAEVQRTLSLDISSLLPAPSALEAFNAVLEYIYTGKTDFPHNTLASIVVTAYVLRIRTLFDVAKQKLLDALEGKDSVGAVGSAIQVLTDAQKIDASEDTAALIKGIIELLILI